MLSGDLSALIGDIYDAALDPQLWVTVLGKCAQFVVGSKTAPFLKDAANKTSNAAYCSGIDPNF
jgi:hypothetical protein